MNFLRTAILPAGMTGLFLAIGFMLGGEAGMAIALLVALAMNAFAYWNSDNAVPRMDGAREVDARREPGFHGIVTQLADALEKMARGAAAIDHHAAEANPATAHMFIINPLHARRTDRLFSTHPDDTANPVRAPRQMAGVVGPWG